MQQPSPESSFTKATPEPTMSRASFMAKLQGKPPDQVAPETAQAPADVTLADALNTKAETAKPGETPKKPKTLKELAETAKLELKDLYDLEFSTEARDGQAVGKSYKLGELKDMLGKVADLEDFETRTAAFEEQRVRSENELLRARQEVQAIIGTLPRDAIKPELLEKVRAEAEKHKAAEAERLLEAVPEWGDDERKEADLKGMAEHLAEYGFGSSTLKGLTDHRLVKFIRDSWQRWDRMNKALAKVKESKPTPKQAPSKVATSPNKRNGTVKYDTPAGSAMELRERFRNLT